MRTFVIPNLIDGGATARRDRVKTLACVAGALALHLFVFITLEQSGTHPLLLLAPPPAPMPPAPEEFIERAMQFVVVDDDLLDEMPVPETMTLRGKVTRQSRDAATAPHPAGPSGESLTPFDAFKEGEVALGATASASAPGEPAPEEMTLPAPPERPAPEIAATPEVLPAPQIDDAAPEISAPAALENPAPEKIEKVVEATPPPPTETNPAPEKNSPAETVKDQADEPTLLALAPTPNSPLAPTEPRDLTEKNPAPEKPHATEKPQPPREPVKPETVSPTEPLTKIVEPPKPINEAAPRQPPTPATPPAPTTEPARPTRPAVPSRQIGGLSAATNGGATRKNRGGAVNIGVASLAVLRDRYGEYMDTLLRRIQEAILIQQQLSPMMFNRGVVTMTFTVNAGGRLANINFIGAAPDNLNYEVAAARNVLDDVKNGKPLKPPTEEMLRDPLFQKITVNFLFEVR